MLHAFSHLVARCCDMLGVVGSDLKWSNFSCITCGFFMTLWSFVQVCAVVRFSITSMSQHFVTGWPNVRNVLRPTMLRYVVLKFCDRLAGGWKYWVNKVAIRCVDIFLLFGNQLSLPGERYSLIWAIWVCAAPNSRVFQPFWS